MSERVERMEQELPGQMVDALNAATAEQLLSCNKHIVDVLHPFKLMAASGVVTGELVKQARIMVAGAGLMAHLLDDNLNSAVLAGVMNLLEKEPLAFIGTIEFVKLPNGGTAMSGKFPSINDPNIEHLRVGGEDAMDLGDGAEAAEMLSKIGIKLH